MGKASNRGALLVKLYMGYGGLFYGLLYWVYVGYALKRDHGRVWVPKEWALYDSSIGRFSCSRIAMLLVNSSLQFLATYAMLLAFEYGLMAGINQGILSGTTNLAAVVSAVLMYLVFKERTTRTQMVGMVFLIASSILLGLNSGDKPDPEDDPNRDPTIPQYLPVLISASCAVMFGIRNVTIRYAVVNMGYEVLSLAIGQSALEGILCAIPATVLIILNGGEDANLMYIIFAAGII